MQPNPVLHKLGFEDDDRVVIIHADDVGMCQASIAAFADLDAFGLVSCGSVMVPCPWFLEAASYARSHPQTDLGVHLTLTSEWVNYRWRPLSTLSPESGLLDPDGFFPHRTQLLWDMGDPQAVHAELDAQIQRAQRAGIQVTHLDTHMGAVAMLKFIPIYIHMAIKYSIPPMVFRLDEAGWRSRGLDIESSTMAVKVVRQLEAQGLPLLDHLAGLTLENPRYRLAQALRAFNQIQPGITHFIIHPAKDTPELRAITPDWACRSADYETFLNDELPESLRHTGIHLIGYKKLWELMNAVQ